METRAALIHEEFGSTGVLSAMEGDDVALSGIEAVEFCGPGDLVFVDNEQAVDVILARRPAVVVTSPALRGRLSGVPGLTLLIAPNVRLAQAVIRQRHADRDVLSELVHDVHPSAVIGADCQIGEGSRIGPHVVLGDGVRIGERTAIMAGSVVEHGAVIGNRVVVHPRVTIGYDCEIGDEVQVQSGAVIGSEGYGFAQDDTGRSHRVPQTGRVVIEDRVSVGAGTCIDRATYGETRIGAGTKFDNLCHVAHNVEIGRDCLFTAGLAVGGSTRIGDRCVASGQTGVLDHIRICDDVYLLHRAGVTEDIDEPGAYAGGPVEPYASYLRNMAVYRKLADLRREVQRLKRTASDR